MNDAATTTKPTTIPIAGADIEIFEHGHGDPILFLHSSEGPRPMIISSACWPRAGASSRRRIRALAARRCRTGSTASTTSPTSISSCSTAGSRKVDLIGSSIGGWIAAEMATKTPERFAHLVLIGPVGVKTGPVDKLDIPDIFAMPQDKLQRLLYHDPEKCAARLQNAQRRASSPFVAQPRDARADRLGTLHAQSQAQAPAAPGERAGAVRCAARATASCRRTISSATPALLPDARIVTIAQAGHVPQLEQPDAPPRRAGIS